jgi:ribosome biogenesis GTPase A
VGFELAQYVGDRLMQQKNIHYFPGHMAKALENLAPFIKACDIVVEVADARAPRSSRNPLFETMIGEKPHLLLLSKSDWADPLVTAKWLAYEKENGLASLSGDLKREHLLQRLTLLAEPLVSKKREKEKKMGMKPQPLRLLIAGIPNVGKSTLINNLAGHAVVKVANRPGVTRAEQWIRLSNDFVLLDTPGILPMNYPDGSEAVRLALLGSIKEEVLPMNDLAIALLSYLRERYPLSLQKRYGIEKLTGLDTDFVLEQIATKRGYLLQGGVPSTEKAALSLIKDFQEGALGALSLEEC